MVQIDKYIAALTDRLKASFGERLLYIGLQGSYLRNEATEHSDIDIMAVIDGLSAEDLRAYRSALVSVGDFDKSCGFICGKSDLAHWNPLEICHLLHTTKDYYGKLQYLVPAYAAGDERNYVKFSLNNLFHELCHRYIHASSEQNLAALPATSKSVFFILQHLHYLDSGEFSATKRELLGCLQGQDKEVLELSIALQGQGSYDFEAAFSLLFRWCQGALARV